MHIIDIIVFLLFTGGVVAFGCSFFKKKGTSEEFTSAGRSLPGWVVGMSIFATYVSSISYLGYPGKAFSGDWNAFVFSLSIPIASYFAARYFVPFYRSQDSISAYSFLENRFGPWARIYASSCYLLTQIARTGSILYLLALPMNVLLGWHIQTIIVVTSVAIVLYSMLGGMKAVIWTEAIQGIILIGGALVCMFILLFDMPGGPVQTFSIAMEDGKFSLGSFGSSLSESTFWVCLIYGIFTNLQNYGIDQSYVQRYHTAKNEKEAKFSALFGGYLFIPVSAVFFMIGTGLYAFYKVHPGILPDGVGADYVFPFFIVNELPVGLTGLLIASIFAADMHRVLQGSLFQIPLQAVSIISSCSSSTQLHRAAPQTCFPEMPKYFQALISYESNLRKMQLRLRIQVLTIPHRAHLPYAVPGRICSQIPERTVCFRPLPRHIKFLPYIIFSSVLFSSSLLPFCHKKTEIPNTISPKKSAIMISYGGIIRIRLKGRS